MTADILVVDDDAALRAIIREVLADEGYQVATARDGQEALELIAALRPALVLLDLEMPVVDGRSVAHELRQRENSVSILLITAASNGREVAKEIGARGCLLKPFGIDDLLRAVSPYVSRSGGPACTHAVGRSLH